MWPKVENFSLKKIIAFFNPSLKIARFYEDGHEYLQPVLQRPPTGSWCSILQSLIPTGGSRHAHGEDHSAGGTSKVQGEGEEANQRCVYTTRRTYAHQNPVVGFPHHTPDTRQCLDGLTSETSKNLDTSIVLEKFSPRNSFFDCKSRKTRSGGWAPRGMVCDRYLKCLKI